MLNEFKEWWNAERVGRIEEDTSQDFCPTNGEAVYLAIVCSLPLIVVLIIILNSGE